MNSEDPQPPAGDPPVGDPPITDPPTLEPPSGDPPPLQPPADDPRIGDPPPPETPGMQFMLDGAPSGEERAWGVLAHLLAAAGYMTGFGYLGWVGPLVVWIKKRDGSPFIAYHALQSLFFQLAWTAVLTVGWSLLFYAHWLIPILFFAVSIPVVWSLIAAVRTFNSGWFEYPVAGGWAREMVTG